MDDRNGKYKKLTPELYGAVIDEAHKHGLRVTVHVYYLDDAKGLLKAGIDAFAHGVRDKDVDEEFMALVKTRPELRPGAKHAGSRCRDRHELACRTACPPEQFKKLQAGAAIDRPTRSRRSAFRRGIWPR